MKRVAILLAVLVAAWAAEEQKNEDAPGQGNQAGLPWPLPDPNNEGDLMLHGAHIFDRVGELRKSKAENEQDKMVLSVGRNFLRLAQKFLDGTPDFKIPAVLCRDSRAMNSTERWHIRVQPKQHQPTGNENQNNQKQTAQSDQQKTQDGHQQTQNDQPEQGQQQQSQQNDPKQSKNQQDNNNNNAKPQQADVVNENATANDSRPDAGYQIQQNNYYEQMGANFARLMMKNFRKENLTQAESEYIGQWTNEEAVHYGVMAIYCHEGENVKEIIKQLATYAEEKN